MSPEQAAQLLSIFRERARANQAEAIEHLRNGAAAEASGEMQWAHLGERLGRWCAGAADAWLGAARLLEVAAGLPAEEEPPPTGG